MFSDKLADSVVKSLNEDVKRNYDIFVDYEDGSKEQFHQIGTTRTIRKDIQALAFGKKKKIKDISIVPAAIKSKLNEGEGLKKSRTKKKREYMFTDKLAEAIEKGLMTIDPDEAFNALVEEYQEYLISEGLDPELTEEEVEVLDELSKRNDYRNTRSNPCYDCGSTIRGQHTPSCDLAPKKSKRDLPEKPGTQYWTRERPKLKSKNENIEQIDELSKGTLGRYLARAGEDRQKMKGHEEDLRRAGHDNYASRETVAGTLRGIYKKTGKFHVEKDFQDNEKAYSDRNSAINKAKDLVQKRGNKRDRGMWRAEEKLSKDHYTLSLKAGAGETKTIKITAASQSEAEAKGKEYAASQTKWALSKVTGRKPKSVKPEAWSVVSVKRTAGSQ